MARGSLLEVMNWTVKANKRDLINSNELKRMQEIFKNLPYQINLLMSNNNYKINKNTGN